MFLANLITIVLAVISFLLILIVLLQRGRGGGIAGALGGMGGQSAFGTKAGDVFTRVTIGIAVVWVLLNCGGIFLNRSESDNYFKGKDEVPASMSEKPDAKGTDKANADDKAGDQKPADSTPPATGDAKPATPAATGPALGGGNAPPATNSGTTNKPAEPSTPPKK